MMRRWIPIALIVLAAGVASCSRSVPSTPAPQPAVRPAPEPAPRTQTVTVEVKQYHRPSGAVPALTDDRLQDKITVFDPQLVHRQPLGGWQINLSEAVTAIDAPMLMPDYEADLLTLHPSYRAAIEAARRRWSPAYPVLPSVNMIDGKAKQFDDGLYAAIDQTYYSGLNDRLTSHVELVHRIYRKVGPNSPAAPFLAAALELAGVSVNVANVDGKAAELDRFRSRETESKPIGFYTWNETLRQCFQFLRFLQREFPASELAIPSAVAEVLSEDPSLLAEYRRVNDFYARLTNPLNCLSAADLIGVAPPDAGGLAALAQRRGASHVTVALFPPSSSREALLFEKLFPQGLPPDANLMHELIRRIRSGQVDLAPQPDSGWYDYQVFALETLLMPERGEENSKLLLTKAYKQRMLEAFQALITKRRETHVRQFGAAGETGAEPPLERPTEVAPRLRVEPCPSYFVRTARAYAFLLNLLESSIGPEALQTLHGLRKEGLRDDNLQAELQFMRDLFYGLYLVSAEDIGLRPSLETDEPVDQEHCYRIASEWLQRAADDSDLATDTRVAIPLLVDFQRMKTRVWVTLGVRLTKLEVAFARPPRIKLPDRDGDWQLVQPDELAKAKYLIPVDEFAEVEVDGRTALTRDELREICNAHQTKEAILAALRSSP